MSEPKQTFTLPFKIKVIDHKGTEIEFPSVMLTVQVDQQPGHWELAQAIESEAKAVLVADLVCELDWDAELARAKAERERRER